MIAQGKKTVADIAKALKARPSSMPFVPIRSSKTFAGRRIAVTALSLQTHSDSLSCQVFHAVWYKKFLADRRRHQCRSGRIDKRFVSKNTSGLRC